MEGKADQKPYYAAFGKVKGIKYDEWDLLHKSFPDIKSAWKARKEDYMRRGFSRSFVENLFALKLEMSPDGAYGELERHGVRVITIFDKGYPKNLKEIYKPPYLLYLKGEIKPFDDVSIAIVGTRNCSSYGERATYDIAKELAEKQVTIVSGLARGLDTWAHKAALAAGGRTIAVCAHGLDIIYPKENRELAEEIARNGALISEYPIGTPIEKQHFPARNRIISGLSLGVIVTEAADKSGTLHTINYGLQQNRNIYTVPGSIYNPMSQIPNKLIREGAKPVIEAHDILEDLEYIDTIAKEQEKGKNGRFNK